MIHAVDPSEEVTPVGHHGSLKTEDLVYENQLRQRLHNSPICVTPIFAKLETVNSIHCTESYKPGCLRILGKMEEKTY